MEQEKQDKLCKLCGQIKTRYFDGKFNKKDKKWRDAGGSLWNGHVCPDCHRDRCKERQRSKRKVDDLTPNE